MSQSNMLKYSFIMHELFIAPIIDRIAPVSFPFKKEKFRELIVRAFMVPLFMVAHALALCKGTIYVKFRYIVDEACNTKNNFNPLFTEEIHCTRTHSARYYVRNTVPGKECRKCPRRMTGTPDDFGADNTFPLNGDESIF